MRVAAQADLHIRQARLELQRQELEEQQAAKENSQGQTAGPATLTSSADAEQSTSDFGAPLPNSLQGRGECEPAGIDRNHTAGGWCHRCL